MSDATLPVLAGLLTALAAESPQLTVYGDVPQTPSFPYVTIGDLTTVDDGDKNTKGETLTATLHIWSRYRGWREAYAIRGQIYDALHEQPLTVSGFSHAQTRFEFADAFPDADGITRHAIARYRIDVHAN